MKVVRGKRLPRDIQGTCDCGCRVELKEDELLTAGFMDVIRHWNTLTLHAKYCPCPACGAVITDISQIGGTKYEECTPNVSISVREAENSILLFTKGGKNE